MQIASGTGQDGSDVANRHKFPFEVSDAIQVRATEGELGPIDPIGGGLDDAGRTHAKIHASRPGDCIETVTDCGCYSRPVDAVGRSLDLAVVKWEVVASNKELGSRPYGTAQRVAALRSAAKPVGTIA